MNKTFLTAVSALAIMVGTPALADTQTQNGAPLQPSHPSHEDSTGDFTKDVEKAWDNTKKDVSEAAEDVSDAAKETYEDVKQRLKDDDSRADMQTTNVDLRNTASAMIGEPVFNTAGDRVAKIHDIIVDESGAAQAVVMADGAFTGLGKQVAFDYSVITSRTAEGDVVAQLSEEMIDSAQNFSYDPAESGEKNVRVLSEGSYSVNALLDADIVDPAGEALAQVDNIVFSNGAATQLVISFGKTLGLGGEHAALMFNDVDIVKQQDSINLKLSESEASQFKQFKEGAMN